MSKVLREALEHIIALRDGYKGGTPTERAEGRKSGYGVAAMIAEQALAVPVWQSLDNVPRDRAVIVSNGKHTAKARWYDLKLTGQPGLYMEGAINPFYTATKPANAWRWAELPAWEEERESCLNRESWYDSFEA